jgi:DNA modification methylase
MTSGKNFGRKGLSDELQYGAGTFTIGQFGARTSVWDVGVGRNKSVKDPYGSQHPAVMPELLARDLIRTYSNYPATDAEDQVVRDTVLDCFGGAGTTPKMATLLGRHSVYIDISPTYLDLAKKRVGAAELSNLWVPSPEDEWANAMGL